MSATLVWQIKPKSSYKSLSFQLRQVLERKWNFPHVVNYDDLNYLEGLKDAHIEGAQELIDLIHQFGDIELNIEC